LKTLDIPLCVFWSPYFRAFFAVINQIWSWVRSREAPPHLDVERRDGTEISEKSDRIIDSSLRVIFSSIACHIRPGARISDSRDRAKTSNDFRDSRLIGGIAREMPIQSAKEFLVSQKSIEFIHDVLPDLAISRGDFIGEFDPPIEYIYYVFQVVTSAIVSTPPAVECLNLGRDE
jgi:hypothetical protein